MIKTFFIFFFFLFIIGCGKSGKGRNTISGKQKKFKVEGIISNGQDRKIYLQQIHPNSTENLDSATIAKNGSFDISASVNGPGLYFLRTEEGSSIIICVKEDEKININADYNHLIDYTISGSTDSEELSLLAKKTNESLNNIGHLSKISMDSIGSPGYSSVKSKLNEDFDAIVNDLRLFTRDFIRKNQTSLISLIALKNKIGPNMQPLNPGKDRDIFLFADSVLMANYPNSELVISFHHELQILLMQDEFMPTTDSRLMIGQQVPDITLPSPDGQLIKLSSLRGKIVLLDFWAAWCPPCREENPNLVAGYEKYRSRGFEIYQVSLDRAREEWLKAIRDDKLNWVHVSDLKQWESEVVPVFGIKTIPANYLIDREGKIIASDLRGKSLIEKLDEIFKP